MQKRRKCAINTNTFWTRDAQNTANTSVLESKAKKLTVNYSIFGKLIAKNAGIYNVSAISSKRGRHETLYINSGVLATFGGRNAGIYAVFCL